MKQNKLKVISAKDLGRLNLPDFCPRCFWIERHMDKPHNRIPGWLPIRDAVEVEEGELLKWR